VAFEVALRAAAAADRIVPPARVVHDREERATSIRVNAVAGGQEDRAGVLHRVGRVVAFFGIGGVVTEEIHGLLAVEIDDAKVLPALDHAAPVAVRLNGLLVDDRSSHVLSLSRGTLAGFPRPLRSRV